MCGIAGVLTRNSDLAIQPLLLAMQGQLRHRGPDDAGLVEVPLAEGQRLGLAHTRLAILDPTDAGHQPMTMPGSGSWITYNGEIYNHFDVRKQLRAAPYFSRSDTETILRGWQERGEEVLSSLRGMFAFALYDGQRRRLWLVRDRLGVKPLYVCQPEPGTWLFASEVRALLATGLVPRRLNARAVRAYLALGSIPAPWTIIDGVQSLLPGERWCFDLDKPLGPPRRQTYWRPVFAPAASRPIRREEAIEQLRPLLQEACCLRMLADVPVGVFLSGGIDSSAVVASLAASGHQPHTFTVALTEAGYGEAQHARAVAERFGTDHHELQLSPDQVLAEFPNALAAYDQPSIDGVNTYFISRAARGAGMKVALSGLGGDELFAGYPYFRWSAFLDHKTGPLLATLGTWFLRGAQAVKLRAMVRAGSDRLRRHEASRQVMSPELIDSLLASHPSGGSVLPDEVADSLRQDLDGLDAVNAYSRVELATYLANTLLRDADQMSMAHALEVREPWLDHVLVETVASLPGALKTRSGTTSSLKGLLVDALPRALPRSILGRRKMGFVLPWEEWLRNSLAPLVDQVLGDASTLSRVGLEPSGVARTWTDFRQRRPGVRASDVLALLHLTFWADKNGVELA